MTGYAGRNFVLKKGNGLTTEVFTTIGGLRSTNMTLNASPVDVSDDSSPWRQMLADGGIQSLDVDGDLVIKSDATLAAMQLAAVNRTPSNYQLVAGNGDVFAFSAVIDSFKRTGPHDNAETGSVSIKSSGTVTFTAGS